MALLLFRERRAEKEGECELAYRGGDATRALIGQEVYLTDDRTVDGDAAVTADDIECGVITGVVSAAKHRMRIGQHAR
ncbi:MAG TPA: hypothetical protein VFU47_06925 [Armatimonadota bacterium]|nr:hypothetical protein [Armatimonadota bacterium]